MRIVLLSALPSFMTIMTASAMSPNEFLADATITGPVTARYFFWDIYDATLYVRGTNDAPNQSVLEGKAPLALELKYLRDIDSDDIATHAISIIRKQGFNDEVTLARWHSLLRNIIPNVKTGDKITGVLNANNESWFYMEDKLLGQVKEAHFSLRFFDIWLGEKTVLPELRENPVSTAGD